MQREQLGVQSKVIYSLDPDKPDITPRDKQELRRAPREQIPFQSDVYTFDDVVAFATVKDSIVGVTIQNQSIADAVGQLFDYTWEALSK